MPTVVWLIQSVFCSLLTAFSLRIGGLVRSLGGHRFATTCRGWSLTAFPYLDGGSAQPITELSSTHRRGCLAWGRSPIFKTPAAAVRDGGSAPREWCCARSRCQSVIDMASRAPLRRRMKISISEQFGLIVTGGNSVVL